MTRTQSTATNEGDRLREMFEQSLGFMALLEGSEHRVKMANRAFFDLVGKRFLIGNAIEDLLPELVEQGLTDLLDRVAASGDSIVIPAMPVRVEKAGAPPRDIFVDFTFQPLQDGDGGASDIYVQGHDVTEHKRSEALRIAHNNVLELAIGDNPLERTLDELVRIVESTSQTGVLGSILLLDEDGRHLRHGAAPSLPLPYIAAINGAEIGPRAGSCGTAAYSASPVFVTDIATDPLWADFRDLALSNGLRACWSIPIMMAGRKVLGTFAMYHREPREPTVRDLALVDLITQTAALVISRERAETALRANEQRFQQLAAQAAQS